MDGNTLESIYFNDDNNDGILSADEYIVEITAEEIGYESCEGSLMWEFSVPEYASSTLTINHESCPSTGDGSFDVEFSNSAGLYLV